MNGPDRRRLSDRAARVVITLGGLAIIASILAMLVFIGAETVPLLRGARVGRAVSLPSPLPAGDPAGPAPLASVNEYLELTAVVSPEGRGVVSDRAGALLVDQDLPALRGQRIRSMSALDGAGLGWVVGTEDGATARVSLEEGLQFTAGGRSYAPRFDVSEPVAVSSGRAVELVTAVADGDGFVTAAWAGDDTVHVVVERTSTNLFGAVSRSISRRSVLLPAGARPTALALEYEGSHLLAGTSAGEIVDWDLRGAPQGISTAATGRHAAFPDGAVTALGFLNGQHSVVLGGSDGAVEVWFRARAAATDAEPTLLRAHRFEPHDTAVLGIAPSQRDRSFVTWDASGEIRLRYGTTARDLATVTAGSSPVSRVLFARKGDAITAVAPDGTMRIFALDNPHPDVSLHALFGRVHYEGQPRPEYTWQSGGGSTDEAEPKISLVPLIFGTMKGTFYALLFSVPIAILAATYTALFMHPRLRASVKPAMELMAALPSVVLGFLAGLWLAPLLAHTMPLFILLPVAVLAFVLGFGWSWNRLPAGFRRRFWPGVEALVLALFLAVAIRTFLALNEPIDAAFHGGFLSWLYETFGVRYDQRNALVIGVAMGLAVIPIIFTISEDSISNVPRPLWAGSLALGATPWQTAVRVILPAASPGIFSAVMIGFGRAVGETMIVLMATGNTPIMSWLPFDGLRSLSANIAVEIPEAPRGGSLYRVLFSTALVLFLITFAANTVAELVRHRLRQRYSRF